MNMDPVELAKNDVSFFQFYFVKRVRITIQDQGLIIYSSIFFLFMQATAKAIKELKKIHVSLL